MSDLSKQVFRMNPDYQVIPANRLSAALQEPVLPENSPAIFAGLLNNQNGQVSMIDADTALLLYAMDRPGPLPPNVLQSWSVTTAADIKVMVGSGILQIQIPRNGDNYISGTSALSLFTTTNQSEGFSAVDINAIKHARQLAYKEQLSLTNCLYCYNRKPVSRLLLRKLYDKESVKLFLGINSDDHHSEKNEFNSSWKEVEAMQEWLAFSSVKSYSTTRKTETYKLYLSPETEKITEIFLPITSILFQAGAMQFKIGKDAFGIQRPDKWVAYFHTKELLWNAIRMLSDRFTDVQGNPVPFTAHTGLAWLSWGKDPKESHADNISWRWLVCTEIANAIIEPVIDTQNNTEDVSFVDEGLWLHIAAHLEQAGINSETLQPMDTWSQ